MLIGRNRDSLRLLCTHDFPVKSKKNKKLKFKLKEVNSNPLGELIADLKKTDLNTNLTLNRNLIKSCCESAETSTFQSRFSQFRAGSWIKRSKIIHGIGAD